MRKMLFEILNDKIGFLKQDSYLGNVEFTVSKFQ